MQCRVCKTEMFVDKVVERETDGVAEFHYKCPNKNCSNYGYRAQQEKGDNMPHSEGEQ